MKLYVGRFTFKTSSPELAELFAQAGTVESASAVEDRETGRSRGFGFVEMASKDEGEAAIAQFRGRALNVNEAKPREDRRGVGSYRVRRNRGRLGFVEMAVNKEGGYVPAGAILVGPVDELKGATLIEDKEAREQVQPFFSGITESRKRARKLQIEINRLKKKTQAIIDKLA